MPIDYVLLWSELIAYITATIAALFYIGDTIYVYTFKKEGQEDKIIVINRSPRDRFSAKRGSRGSISSVNSNNTNENADENTNDTPYSEFIDMTNAN